MYFLVITIVAFWHKYTLSLVLNGQELNIDDIPVDVSIDVPLVNSEERNEPKLESVVINHFTMDDLENDLDNENDQEWSNGKPDAVQEENVFADDQAETIHSKWAIISK